MLAEKYEAQIYFEENQPEFQEANILELTETIKDQKMFGSCIISRSVPRTAPIRSIRVSAFKNQILPSASSPKKIAQKITFRRKLTFESSPSPKKPQTNFPNQLKNNSSLGFRSIYSSKKQTLQLESLSPEIYPKTHFQSQSPNRKKLYQQSTTAQQKLDNFGSNASGYMSRTLKPYRDQLPPISAPSFIAMMSDSKEFLAERNIDQKRQIASLTKIMTAYTVIKICNAYGVKMRQHKVTIHEKASWMQGTSANLKTDQTFYIYDLIYGLLLPSGNDAGVALAQHFGKFLSFKLTKDTYQEQNQQQQLTSMNRFQFYKDYYDTQYEKDSIKLFVFQMNKNSHKIGLKNTHFANPTGLSNSKNYSTARDIALLTAHCLNNHILRDVFKKKSYTCQATNEKLAYVRQVTWKNTNKHLYLFKQCIGVKTGITPTAGPCLSSAYKVLNREVVVVVLNSSSIQDRYEDAKNIYKWCRRNMKIPF